MRAFDQTFCLETFEKLLSVDSTTGWYEDIQALTCSMLDELGYSYELVHKGGVVASIGGVGDPLVITAHLDDIGLMVRHINAVPVLLRHRERAHPHAR